MLVLISRLELAFVYVIKQFNSDISEASTDGVRRSIIEMVDRQEPVFLEIRVDHGIHSSPDDLGHNR